ncbi:MAG TPA: aldo/keto reductase, partial [Mucilaginibacter sp.]|nr:aldo/keto reductase [Mucilaginibacter sp.]
KAIGIAEKHGWNKFVGLQYYYSLTSRDIEREVLPLALDQNLAVMPWSPLAGGFLSGKYTRNTEKAGDSRRDVFDFPPVNRPKAYDIIDVITEVGKQYNISAAQVALAWVRLQKGVTSTIIGAKNVDQLKDNVSSTNVILSEDDLKKINEVSALQKEYPGWMVERQSADREIK